MTQEQRDGRISAVETVEKNLSRIHALDDLINANITVLADEALAAARQCDEQQDRGERLGVLHGMTIGIKDNIDTAGVRTTVGSQFFADRIPDADAAVVAKLIAAGAIIVSKLNLHEFAFGGTNQNVHFGSCRNPWDTDRIPGGSSGGAGAAVAAEMVQVAIGTDTGSSVRMPASITGVVGIRPTKGRVSNRGVFPVSQLLDTVGPMAYRAEDVARVLAVIEGYDDQDPSAEHGPADDILQGLHDGIDGVKIGVPTNFFFANCDPRIETCVRDALDVLASLGAELVPVKIPGAEDAAERIFPVICSDAAAVHQHRLANEPEKFGPEERDRLLIGMNVSGVEYARSMEWMRRWRRQLAELFQQVDIIASPTVPVITPRVADIHAQMISITNRLTEKTYAYPMGGNPALSVPVGFVDGLPVGMQLAGAWWRDGMLLRAACAYQSVTKWHTYRPARAS